ncbi:MAG TPA: peptidoglycan DD-metalloendopeptidase family protein [Herpetosiphonaceae bacterium]
MRHRVVFITCSLVIATLLTSLLVHQQTSLLLEANAAPTRPTTPVERQLEAQPERTSEPAHPGHEPGGPPTVGPEVPPPDPPRAALIERQRFFYEPDFYGPQIQAFLETQPGPLKHYRATVGNREHSFADLLSSQTTLYSINPKVVLALIEQQSGILSTGAPSEDQQRFMLGFRGEEERRAGWVAQLRWAIRELHRAQRDFPGVPDLVYADQTHSPMPPGLSIADYAVMRVLAATTTADGLPAKLDQGSGSFVATYARLFGDPRDPVAGWPEPAQPFLSPPMEALHETTSFFDHDAPFLTQDGSIVTYRGDRDEQLSYDGHDGWDYGMLPPEPVLSAADGTVVFAGNSDDGCGIAHVVIIEHHNGYRTLYWHLARATVEPGPIKRGEHIGIAGSSGCATGPHLHFQVQYLGRDTDPAGWCGPKGGDPWANHPAGQISTWIWRDVPSPCALPQDAIVVDTTDPSFKRLGDGWDEIAQGIGGTALNVISRPDSSSQLTIGTWRPKLPGVGTYRVLAWVPYVPNGLKDAGTARYVVGHADGSGDAQEVTISQMDTANGWADLGVYDFDPARRPFVGLAANDTEAGNNVWYDAIIWIPVK